MNQFKEEVLKELQDVKLTEARKQVIAEKARSKNGRKTSSPWQYRVVLATFTIFVIGFSYLLSQNKDQHSGSHQAASLQQEADTWSILGLLEYDLVKGILICSVFQIIAFLIRRYLKKKKYGLPVCIQCGESWSYKQSHKLLWTNNAKPIECKHCGQKQYRTNKSMRLNGILQIPILHLILLTNVTFQNVWVGIGFYLISTISFYWTLAPFLFAFQEKDPMKEPQKPLW
ncbi:TIGR04104 family putative zinc finger protein [Lysinibacillus sp. TE18511]